MSEEKAELEIIASSVEEAVEKGLSQLGLTSEDVEIEILDGGAKGVLGIGSRLARVRLTTKQVKQEVQSATEELTEDLDQSDIGEIDGTDTAKTPEDLQTLKTSRNVTMEILERMRVKATVHARFIEPDDDKDERVVLIDIRGNDLSILIGRHSETLNALQYIISLIISREVNHWVPILVDVQGYRSRRERQLRMLGRKMADQAVQSGKKQTLEPMPANERRVIHMELRNHPLVFTESVGEDPNRKITISLKKPL
jgi:spoIIIJ-associated protein